MQISFNYLVGYFFKGNFSHQMLVKWKCDIVLTIKYDFNSGTSKLCKSNNPSFLSALTFPASVVFHDRTVTFFLRTLSPFTRLRMNGVEKWFLNVACLEMQWRLSWNSLLLVCCLVWEEKGGYMYYGFLMMQLESDRQLCRLGVQLL